MEPLKLAERDAPQAERVLRPELPVGGEEDSRYRRCVDEPFNQTEDLAFKPAGES